MIATAVYQYKTVIGKRIYDPALLNQRTEAKIACNVINRMTFFGMPAAVRVV